MAHDKPDSIEHALELYPDLKHLNDLLNKFAEEWSRRLPHSLPDCFKGDAGFLVTWHMLNNGGERMPEYTRSKVPRAKEVMKYCREHPELNVGHEFCELVLSLIEDWQKRSSS